MRAFLGGEPLQASVTKGGIRLHRTPLPESTIVYVTARSPDSDECSFCGQSTGSNKLVRGERANICRACASRCHSLLFDAGREDSAS